MRTSLFFVAAACLFACSSSSTTASYTDAGTAPVDAAGGMDSAMPPADAAGGMDAAPPVMPFNMAGSVFCYGSLTCSTMSAAPVCCDAKVSVDGGTATFTDTCVASAAACAAMSTMATSYQCGQSADCASAMVCCGALGMSSSGKAFFTSTTCAATCPSSATSAQLCASNSDCTTSGQTCVGKAISGRDVGLCQ